MGLYILVDDAALVQLAQCRDDADGEAQEACNLHRCAEQSVQRLAARILEHQHDLAALAHQLERAHGPGAVELVPQSIFVGEAIDTARRDRLGGRNDGQDGGPGAAIRPAPGSAEGAFAVLPQDRETARSIGDKSRGCFHWRLRALS